MSKIKVLVLRSPGTNCDEETKYAFEAAGKNLGASVVAERVHVNKFVRGQQSFEEFHCIALPGGFAFGDDLGSGKVLANKLAFSLEAPLRKFVEEGKLVIGICNGFQVLVKARLLPGFETVDSEQLCTLSFNDSGKFEDRWTYLNAPKSKCIFTRGMARAYFACRHGEGKFIVKSDSILQKLQKSGQIALRYCGEKGESNPGYPWNPNGSIDDVAGVCNPKGNVFGMMPHPEVFNNALNHPRWARGEANAGDGLKIFENAVNFAIEKLI